jgi:hypothetical protein
VRSNPDFPIVQARHNFCEVLIALSFCPGYSLFLGPIVVSKHQDCPTIVSPIDLQAARSDRTLNIYIYIYIPHRPCAWARSVSAPWRPPAQLIEEYRPALSPGSHTLVGQPIWPRAARSGMSGAIAQNRSTLDHLRGRVPCFTPLLAYFVSSMLGNNQERGAGIDRC